MPSRFSLLLLQWYDKARRDLPWRGEEDPYKIWLSEVMLQQTQVETVIPYYIKWVERFPSIESVALATQDELLKFWEGLGYYSRCRNFHKACKIVASKHGGKVPTEWETFLSFPGVGEYTAAAVLSIAFHQPYSVIDGNVKRVMARLLAFSEIVEKGTALFEEKLDKWLNQDRPGDFNQAMMELGSQICRRNKPRCFECPVESFCKAKAEGNPAVYPNIPKKKERPHKTIVAGIIWNDDKFLIQKRPDAGLLGGLWEFPGGKVEIGEALDNTLVREIREETGLIVEPGKKVGAVDHAYTHFSITLHLYHCKLSKPLKENGAFYKHRWIQPDERSQFAFPGANHKLFQILEFQKWTDHE